MGVYTVIYIYLSIKYTKYHYSIAFNITIAQHLIQIYGYCHEIKPTAGAVLQLSRHVLVNF